MIKKTVKRSEDLFIQFTDEEMSSLNVKPGDKFSWEVQGDSVMLRKYGTIEIDLSEFSRETLEMLIIDSIEKDITINEVIEQILETYLECNDG